MKNSVQEVVEILLTIWLISGTETDVRIVERQEWVYFHKALRHYPILKTLGTVVAAGYKLFMT